MSSTTAGIDVGERVRQLRLARELSVRTLAARTEFSPSFISQVEHGQASPSIASLERIAAALGTTLVEFFDVSPARPVAVVRAGESATLHSTWSRAAIRALAPGGAGAKLDPVMITIEPGGRSGNRPEAHSGDEFVYILEGEATFVAADEMHVLRPGDAVTFSSEIPHQWENTGETITRLLIVSPRFRH